LDGARRNLFIRSAAWRRNWLQVFMVRLICDRSVL
jgi:hypothetical protein